MIKRLLSYLASAKVSVSLFLMVMLLVVVGTIAQLDNSILVVRQRFFESFLITIDLYGYHIPIFPGGYSLGFLLAANLVAAGFVKWRLVLAKPGLALAHSGMLVMLAGMMLSAAYTEESYLELKEGESKNFSEDLTHFELAVASETEGTISISEEALQSPHHIDQKDLPFRIEVPQYYPHSHVALLQVAGPAFGAAATKGDGRLCAVRLAAVDSKSDQRRTPSVLVSCVYGKKSLGSWLVSAAQLYNGFALQPFPVQEVEVDGVSYQLSLRPKRDYTDYFVRLNEFRHERYEESNIPKSFSSHITIIDEELQRDHMISMNHPLRLQGRTYYQSGFKDHNSTSILLVVKNSSVSLVYFACVCMGVGFLLHFGQTFIRKKKREGAPKRKNLFAWVSPMIVSAVVISLFYHYTASDLDDFGRIPMLARGRMVPIDTVARNSLLRLSGKQKFKYEGNKITATRWLLDHLAHPEKADQYPVFRIDHLGLLNAIGVDHTGRYYSFKQLLPHLPVIEHLAARHRNDSSPFFRSLNLLDQRITLYRDLRGLFSENQAQLLFDASAIIDAWHDGDGPAFKQALNTTWAQSSVQKKNRFQVRLEFLFNRVQPFFLAMVFYIHAAVLLVLAFCFPYPRLHKGAWKFCCNAVMIHSIGIIWRVLIHGYAPVTNLYSSAVVVGWGGAVLGLFVERKQKNSIGVLCSVVIGIATLIIAHHLARAGDTMEMLRAVLNSNFWLTAHVLTIIVGYSLTFFAGTLAAIMIIGRAMRHPRSLVTKETVHNTLRCAFLLTLIGTILGGVWADHSWGRFWGWDPKENGALLTVIWTALILHAHFSRLVHTRGMMVLTVFGNVVTACAWFGVNMLGIGLHSYGWLSGGIPWLILFTISQITIMLFALLWKKVPDVEGSR